MILPERLPPPEEKPMAGPYEQSVIRDGTQYALGWNEALDAVALANMEPDGHYWDHTSKEYRAMVQPPEGTSPPGYA